MTDKLICPFCGEKLKTRKLLCGGTKDYVCVNKNCNFSYMPLPLKFWQALVDADRATVLQKKLDKAMELLDGVKEICAKNNRWLTVAKISAGKKEIEDIKE